MLNELRLEWSRPMHSLPKMLSAEAGALAWGVALLRAALVCCAVTLSNAQIVKINEYPVPPEFSQPVRIVTGPDGALWFTDNQYPRIGRITTTGAITTYTVPATSNGWGITPGPDGALWFTAQDKIGRMTTDGVVTMYPVSATSFTYGITTGPDGALWFTDAYSFTGNQPDAVGRITTDGIVTEYPLAGQREPTFITSGSDGALWFAEVYPKTAIGRVTTAGTITEYAGPGPAGGCSGGGGWITPGPDDALWFTGDDRIGRITTARVVTGYPDLNCRFPAGITTGPDGALWFTEIANIGRITTGGIITEYAVPQLLEPLDITTGPDKALWFLEYANNKIGQIILAQSCMRPGIREASANPSVLWPPNHQFVTVNIPYKIASRCGGACSLSVASNEGDNANGSGETAPDWLIINAHTVQLRAERAGQSQGRIYTITITCTNSAGTTKKQVYVLVPQNQGK